MQQLDALKSASIIIAQYYDGMITNVEAAQKLYSLGIEMSEHPATTAAKASNG